MISLSEKTISSMVRGHSSVTRETAEAIVKLFPDYRLEWLLGIDDIKTMCEIDILNDLQQKYDEKWDDIFKNRFEIIVSAVSMIAKTINTSITRCKDGALIIDTDYGPKHEREYPPMFPAHVRVSHNGALLLMDSVQDFFRQKFAEMGVMALYAGSENLYTPMPPITLREMQDYAPLEGRSPHAPQEQ